MRLALFLVGLAVLAVSAVTYNWATQQLVYFYSNAGLMARAMDDSVNDRYLAARDLQLAVTISAVAGIGLCIFGALYKGKRKEAAR